MQENNELQESVVSTEEIDIVKKLKSIAEKIETIEEWKKYINMFCEQCCKRMAKIEISNSIKNSEGANLKRPIAVITAGQPGSGKTPLINELKNRLNEEYGVKAVINNADLYRFCVPGSKRITKAIC